MATLAENSESKQKHTTLTCAHKNHLKTLEKLTKIILSQNLTVNLGQNVTVQVAKNGPEPNFTAYIYI